MFNHHVDPTLRAEYANAAGQATLIPGRPPELPRKKLAKGATETHTQDLIYVKYNPAQTDVFTQTQAIKESSLNQGHATTKQSEKRAGMLSADIWRP